LVFRYFTAKILHIEPLTIHKPVVTSHFEEFLFFHSPSVELVFAAFVRSAAAQLE